MIWVVSLSSMELIPHRLTAIFKHFGIRSLTEFSKLVGPLAQSVLYPQCGTYNASPKAISGRTSYLQVRLAFHRYPRLIPAIFNLRGFGPPASVTWPSPWSWVDHLVSGLRPPTASPSSDSLSLRLRLCGLTLQTSVTRRFILQKARRHPLTGSDFL